MSVQLTVEDRLLLAVAADFLREDMAREMRRGRVEPRDLSRHRKAMDDLEAAKRRLGVMSGSV